MKLTYHKTNTGSANDLLGILLPSAHGLAQDKVQDMVQAGHSS